MRLITGMIVLMLSACGDGGSQVQNETQTAEPAVVRGDVWYRERIRLPSGAEVIVQLEDAARADGAAVEIASTRLAATAGPPYEFALPYESGRISQGGRYQLRARIEHEGRLVFTSDTPVPAFDGEGPISILVVRAAAPANAAREAGLGGYWVLEELGGTPAGKGAGGSPAHIEFLDQGQVAGFGGCNRFGGGYEVDGTRLALEDLASTTMACADGMELETRFHAELSRVRGYQRADGDLVLMDGDGTALMRFTPAQPGG